MKQAGKRKQFGRCKFCDCEKNLCNAHLLPDSLRKLIENFKISGAYINSFEVMENKSRPVQTLPSDRNILCSDCDGLLGKYDKRLVEILSRWVKLPARKHQFWLRTDKVYYRVPGVVEDFLFGLMACLLRFSFSSQHPGIRLSGEVEKLLINALSHGKMSDEMAAKFSIKIIGSHQAIVDGTVDLSGVFAQSPFYGVWDGIEIFTFELVGLTCLIKVGAADWKAFANVISPVQEWDAVRILATHFDGSMASLMLNQALEVRRQAFSGVAPNT